MLRPLVRRAEESEDNGLTESAMRKTLYIRSTASSSRTSTVPGARRTMSLVSRELRSLRKLGRWPSRVPLWSLEKLKKPRPRRELLVRRTLRPVPMPLARSRRMPLNRPKLTRW